MLLWASHLLARQGASRLQCPHSIPLYDPESDQASAHLTSLSFQHPSLPIWDSCPIKLLILPYTPLKKTCLFQDSVQIAPFKKGFSHCPPNPTVFTISCHTYFWFFCMTGVRNGTDSVWGLQGPTQGQVQNMCSTYSGPDLRRRGGWSAWGDDTTTSSQLSKSIGSLFLLFSLRNIFVFLL